MTAPTAPRAILFDWDNTLVDNWAVISGALNAAFQAMAKPTWSEAECRARVRKSARDTFPELFGDRWREAERIFYSTFEERHLEGLRPMPGAIDLLDRARTRGLYLGIVSNKHGRYLRIEAEHLGWSRRFGRIVGATDAAADKPAPDPVHAALAGSGIVAGPDVWFVGDAGVDMQCALAAGCTPVLVRDEETLGEEFDSCAPHVHLRGCPGLAALL
ncbi:HAD family hydrolase [Stella sp.]|uniref:HAD family hydrolase n=1 Tax=Stella sp. TaxID=2912054 RepID=UPI0035B14429